MPRKTTSRSRLEALKRAHATGSTRPTPRTEDYLEVIYELISEKGYARIVDIGGHLAVGSPTVTKTIQRLHLDGLAIYERYRGVVLTAKGEQLARDMKRRHDVVAAFLRLIGVDEASAHRETEGVEHHLGARTLDELEALVAHARENPAWWREFEKRRRA